jgi:hypothetical protein
MTSKISLLSMVLMFAGFLSTAQNSAKDFNHFNSQHSQWEYVGLERFDMEISSSQSKYKVGGNWWQPDTLYGYEINSELPFSRLICSYNSQGLVTARLYQMNFCGNWTNISKFTYTYDARNNRLTELYQPWRNEDWDNHHYLTSIYDAQNNLLIQLSQYWIYGNWKNTSKSTFTYDVQNIKQTRLYQTWQNENWKDQYKSTYTYDTQNNMLSEFEQTWLDENWKNYCQYTYTYDDQNNRITRIYQTCYDENWKIWNKYTYTYDADKNLITTFFQLWQEGNWQNSGKYNYTYDAQNNRVTTLYQSWQDEKWKNNSTTMWNYDINNNATIVEYWTWAGENLQPATAGGLTLFYNQMQSNIELSYDYVHKVTTTYIKVPNPSSIEKFLEMSISIYPNPTTGKLNITSEEQNIQLISLCNLSGIKLFSTQDTILDISHLVTGIYFVQIITKKGIVTKKIVKI